MNHPSSAMRERPGTKTSASSFPFTIPMWRLKRLSAQLLHPVVSKIPLTKGTNHLSLNPNKRSGLLGGRTQESEIRAQN